MAYAAIRAAPISTAVVPRSQINVVAMAMAVAVEAAA